MASTLSLLILLILNLVRPIKRSPIKREVINTSATIRRERRPIVNYKYR